MFWLLGPVVRYRRLVTVGENVGKILFLWNIMVNVPKITAQTWSLMCLSFFVLVDILYVSYQSWTAVFNHSRTDFKLICIHNGSMSELSQYGRENVNDPNRRSMEPYLSLTVHFTTDDLNRKKWRFPFLITSERNWHKDWRGVSTSGIWRRPKTFKCCSWLSAQKTQMLHVNYVHLSLLQISNRSRVLLGRADILVKTSSN